MIFNFFFSILWNFIIFYHTYAKQPTISGQFDSIKCHNFINLTYVENYAVKISALLSPRQPKIFHTWLVRIQTTLSVWQMFRYFHQQCVGFLLSIWPVWSPPGSLVWWWTCHKLCLSATFVKVWGKKPSGSRSTSFFSFVLCLEVMPRQ